MRLTKLILPLAALSVATALVPGSVAAAPTPVEAGCRNIVDKTTFGFPDSAIGYIQAVERVSQSGTGTLFDPYGPAVAVTQNRGIFDAQLQLEALSCTDVTYTFNVYAQLEDGSTGNLLETFSKKGDGAAQRVVFEDIANGHDGDCVKVQAVVSDRHGVADTAPDAGLLSGVCGPPATASFR